MVHRSAATDRRRLRPTLAICVALMLASCASAGPIAGKIRHVMECYRNNVLTCASIFGGEGNLEVVNTCTSLVMQKHARTVLKTAGDYNGQLDKHVDALCAKMHTLIKDEHKSSKPRRLFIKALTSENSNMEAPTCTGGSECDEDTVDLESCADGTTAARNDIRDDCKNLTNGCGCVDEADCETVDAEPECTFKTKSTMADADVTEDCQELFGDAVKGASGVCEVKKKCACRPV